MSRLETSISVLERTLSDPQCVTGQHLESALHRQLHIRREELDNIRSRDQSVIVYSTPNQTQNASHPSDFFGSQEEIINIREAPRFQIYFDPPIPSPSPRPPIIKFNTPSTVFSACGADKENRFPFGPVSPSRAGIDMAGSEENSEDDHDVLRREFAKKVRDVGIELQSLTQLYSPSNYPAEVLLANKDSWLKRVEEGFKKFTSLLFDFEEEEWPTDEDRADMQQRKDTMTAAMNEYILSYNTKMLSLGATTAPASVNVSPTLPALSPSISNASTLAAEQAKKAALIEVDICNDKLNVQIKSLKSEIGKIEDWSKAESHQVEAAMSKINSWKRKLETIQEILFTMKKLTLTHDIDPTKLRSNAAAVNCLDSELTLVIDNVEFEDESRCLYSLSSNKSSEVKMPSFSGIADEDYLKFETEAKEAFRTNKVKRDDQPKKLREVLKGQAKSIIPESLKNIDEIFHILKQMYGCPSRLVKARKSKLLSLGQYPKSGSKAVNHVKSQMEWLLRA